VQTDHLIPVDQNAINTTEMELIRSDGNELLRKVQGILLNDFEPFCSEFGGASDRTENELHRDPGEKDDDYNVLLVA
jgi:hypothetical protein